MKKIRKRILSIVLTCAMVVSLLAGVPPIEVKAEGTELTDFSLTVFDGTFLSSLNGCVCFLDSSENFITAYDLGQSEQVLLPAEEGMQVIFYLFAAEGAGMALGDIDSFELEIQNMSTGEVIEDAEYEKEEIDEFSWEELYYDIEKEVTNLQPAVDDKAYKLTFDFGTLPTTAYNTSVCIVVDGEFESLPLFVTKQPESPVICIEGNISCELSVAAEASDGSELTYQWYAEGEAVTGATSATFSVPTDLQVGTYSYYCIITAGDNEVQTNTSYVYVNPSVTNLQSWLTVDSATGAYTITPADGVTEYYVSTTADVYTMNEKIGSVVTSDNYVTLDSSYTQYTAATTGTLANGNTLVICKVDKNKPYDYGPANSYALTGVYGYTYTASGESTENTEHTCNDINYQAISQDDYVNLTETGNYYLTEDITIDGTATISGTVNICLNGHILSGTQIIVSNGATLNVYDCSSAEHKYQSSTTAQWTLSEAGDMTITGGVIGCPVIVNSGGTLLLNSGNICGVYGCAINNSGTTTIGKAASVIGNYSFATSDTGSGVVINGNNAVFTNDGKINNNVAVLHTVRNNGGTFTNSESGTINNNIATSTTDGTAAGGVANYSYSTSYISQFHNYGQINYNTSARSSGGVLNKAGEFTNYATGQINENVAARHCGGVDNTSKAYSGDYSDTFFKNYGQVNGNKVLATDGGGNGAGIYNEAYAAIYNYGEVCNNTAVGQGGGIFFNDGSGILYVGGDSKVTGNKDSSDNDSNICIGSGKVIKFDTDNTLTDNAKMGVYLYSNGRIDGTVSSGYTTSYPDNAVTDYFFADASTQYVKLENSEVYLATGESEEEEGLIADLSSWLEINEETGEFTITPPNGETYYYQFVATAEAKDVIAEYNESFKAQKIATTSEEVTTENALPISLYSEALWGDGAPIKKASGTVTTGTLSNAQGIMIFTSDLTPSASFWDEELYEYITYEAVTGFHGGFYTGDAIEDISDWFSYEDGVMNITPATGDDILYAMEIKVVPNQGYTNDELYQIYAEQYQYDPVGKGIIPSDRLSYLDEYELTAYVDETLVIKGDVDKNFEGGKIYEDSLQMVADDIRLRYANAGQTLTDDYKLMVRIYQLDSNYKVADNQDDVYYSVLGSHFAIYDFEDTMASKISSLSGLLQQSEEDAHQITFTPEEGKSYVVLTLDLSKRLAGYPAEIYEAQAQALAKQYNSCGYSVVQNLNYDQIIFQTISGYSKTLAAEFTSQDTYDYYENAGFTYEMVTSGEYQLEESTTSRIVAVYEIDTSKFYTITEEHDDFDPGKYYPVVACHVVSALTLPPTITITTQPESMITVTEGSITESLVVEATISDGSELKYQWYDYYTNSPIEGATSNEYKLRADLPAGDYKYFCVISDETGAAVVQSSVVRVLVEEGEHVHNLKYFVSEENTMKIICDTSGCINPGYLTITATDAEFSTGMTYTGASLNADQVAVWEQYDVPIPEIKYYKDAECTEEVTVFTEAGTYYAAITCTNTNGLNTVTVKDAFTLKAHDHCWKYIANGNVLTLICDGEGACPVQGGHDLTITAEAVSGNKGMVCKGATIDEDEKAEWESMGITVPEIKYYSDEACTQEVTTFTATGTYYAAVSATGDNGTVGTAKVAFAVTVTESPSVHTHSLTLVPAKAATCTETGNKAYYTCSGCDSLFADANGTTITTAEAVKVAALDHDWTGEWVVIKEATATEDGKKETFCTRGCGQKMVAIIPATGTTDDNGNLEKDAEVAPDAPIDEATLNNSKEELLEAGNIFTDAEKTQIANETNARVWIEISKTDESAIASTDKAKIEQEAAKIIGNNPTITYFDADLFKQVGSGAKQEITEPGIAMKITIVIPDELLNADKKVSREYKIIRLHEGQVDVINGTFDSTTGEFAFETDKFSTYAIVYKDVPVNDNDDNSTPGDDDDNSTPGDDDDNSTPGDDDDNSTPGDTDVIKPEDDKKDEVPKTGDSNTTLYSFILMLLSGLGIIICSGKKKLLNKES